MPTRDNEDGDVGYRRPPKSTQFKPGRSGNPRGRPKGAKGTRASVKRVLLEEHRADPHMTGRPQPFTALELVLLLLKQMAAAGDQRAYRSLMDLDRRMTPAGHGAAARYLIVPERLSEEEWEAKHSPKEVPPSDGEESE